LENFPAPNLPPFAFPPLAGYIKENQSEYFIKKETKIVPKFKGCIL
jgi:hypothetical protein